MSIRLILLQLFMNLTLFSLSLFPSVVDHFFAASLAHALPLRQPLHIVLTAEAKIAKQRDTQGLGWKICVHSAAAAAVFLISENRIAVIAFLGRPWWGTHGS